MNENDHPVSYLYNIYLKQNNEYIGSIELKKEKNKEMLESEIIKDYYGNHYEKNAYELLKQVLTKKKVTILCDENEKSYKKYVKKIKDPITFQIKNLYEDSLERGKII